MNQFFNADYFKNFQQFPQFQTPQFDAGDWMNFVRKNIESVSAASQIANETAQAVARRSTEFFRENVENALTAGRDLMTTSTPDQNATKQAEFAKKAVQSGMDQFREMTEMTTKSQFEAFDLLSSRFSQGIEEAKKMATKKAA